MIKDVWIMLYGYSFILVNAHPLAPSTHPGLNYQQNVYRSPNSEAFVLQPSNNNPYSQHVFVQTPPSSYQSMQAPSILEQISQIYWDKLLSNPTVRNLVDPNNIMYNQYGKNLQNNIHPCGTGGGVVNNYLILPPDYFKNNDYNETVSKSSKTKRVKNYSKGHHDRAKKKKDPNIESAKAQNVESLSVKNEKVKQNKEKSWNFISDNIKCFTPADILNNEKYQPVEKTVNINEDTKICKTNGNKTPKKTKEIDNKDNSKPRKINKNKSQKQSKKNKVKEKAIEKESSSTKTHKKINQRKKVLDLCDCIDNDELPDCKYELVENIPECCRQDMNDDLYTKLLQQSCTDLDNRRTRNSKSDAVKKDFRNAYDFSDDITKSMNWYMSDIFSPQTFQKGPNTNFLLGNNMYPFDLSQLYQNPQFSNKDQSSKNAGKNKNTKQKKKKKKKSSKTKIQKENSTHIEDSDNSILDTSIQLLETSTQVPEIKNENAKNNTQESETNIHLAELIVQIAETNPQILDKVAKIVENIKNIEKSSKRSETSTKIPEIDTKEPVKNIDVNEIMTNEATPHESMLIETSLNEKSPIETNLTLTTEEVTTYTVNIESNTTSEKILDYFREPTKNKEEIKNPKTCDQNENLVNVENQEGNIKEMFETQILESVKVQEGKSNNNPENEGEINKHLPSTIDFQVYDEISESGPEDELLHVYDNRLMYDYYPDFTADNHAYLVSEEGIDFRDIHDRYFYTSDRNIDSREDIAAKQKSQCFSEKIVFSEDELQKKNSINANVANESDKSQEIIFKTPPVLESPDFITRKINRDRQDSTEIIYQPQYYDDHIDRLNLDNFADRSVHVIKTADGQISNENKPGSLVETVYARSKVVKYGQGQETNKRYKPEVKNNFQLLKDEVQNDVEKTVVIAKSLPLGDFW